MRYLVNIHTGAWPDKWEIEMGEIEANQATS